MIKVVCGIRGCWPTIAAIVTTTETSTVETVTPEVKKDVTGTKLQPFTLIENIPFMGIVISVSSVLLLIYVISLWKIYSMLNKMHRGEDQEEP